MTVYGQNMPGVLYLKQNTAVTVYVPTYLSNNLSMQRLDAGFTNNTFFDVFLRGVSNSTPIHLDNDTSEYLTDLENYGWLDVYRLSDVKPQTHLGVKLAISKQSSETSRVTTFRTSAELFPIGITNSTIRATLLPLLTSVNCSINNKGTIVSVDLTASDTDTLGILEVKIGAARASDSMNCYPFLPATFVVTPDGIPPNSGPTFIC
jgi:hypothetical protein